MENLKLYKLSTCPYCKKVLRFLEKHNLELGMVDISDEDIRKELIDLGGDDQVPALLIEDKIMYESDDIIKYIAEKNNLEVVEDDLETDANYCPIY